MNIKRPVSILLSGVLLFWIYSKVPIHDVWSVFNRLTTLKLIGSLLLIYPILMITALRFWLIIKTVTKETLTYSKIVYMVNMSSISNLILPAKLGDLTKVYWLKNNKKIGKTMAFASVMFEKWMDVLSILTFAIAGMILFYHEIPFSRVLFPSLILLFLLSLSSVMSATFSRFLSKLIITIKNRIHHKKLKKITKVILKSMWNWRQVQVRMAQQKGAYFKLWGVSLLNSCALFTQFWVFASVIGATVPLSFVLGVLPLVVLSALFPFTLAGVGVREGALMLFFSTYLTPAQVVILGALSAIRFTMLIPVMLIKTSQTS